MMAKVIFTLAALALQYLLLHSHKTGPSPWIWIASTSAVLMLVGVSSLRVVEMGRAVINSGAARATRL